MVEIVDIAWSQSETPSHPQVSQDQVSQVQARPATRPQHPVPAGCVHLGFVREIAPTLREFNFDPVPIIKAAGLDPSVFDDSSYAIPHRALGRLYALCVARTQCPHFGLLA